MSARPAGPGPRLPRWLLFALSLGSLVVLTYAGIVLAFSVEVTEDMATTDPKARPGSRAVVIPITAPEAVPTLAANQTPALIISGDREGTFPTSARDARLGKALAHVPAGSNGTLEIANASFDLWNLTEGHAGWILQDASANATWFVTEEETLGEVARFESPGRLTLLFAASGVGFLAPLLTIVLTHRGGTRPGAPQLVCRECRAPMREDSEFCIRCGAYRSER